MTIDASTARRGRRAITPAEVAEWRDLYDAGHGTIEIGEQADRAHSSVYLALVRAGVAMRPPGRKTRLEWPIGWCDECGDTRPLNPRSGWCGPCTRTAGHHG